jgi:hypothetical protein
VAYNKHFLEGRGIRKTTKYLSELPVCKQRFEGVHNYEMEVAVTNIRRTERMEENRYSCNSLLGLLLVPPLKLQSYRCKVRAHNSTSQENNIKMDLRQKLCKID